MWDPETFLFEMICIRKLCKLFRFRSLDTETYTAVIVVRHVTYCLHAVWFASFARHGMLLLLLLLMVVLLLLLMPPMDFFWCCKGIWKAQFNVYPFSRSTYHLTFSGFDYILVLFIICIKNFFTLSCSQLLCRNVALWWRFYRLLCS